MPGIVHQLVDKNCYVTEVLPDSSLLELGAVYLNKKRISQNVEVKAGDYLRIHTMPKRYNTTSSDWRVRIIFENEDLVIINKPAGLPVHATLDNQIENVLYQAQKYLKILLYHTHRLDIGTEGLLILTKNKPAQAMINNWFLDRKIKKIYKAIVNKTPNPGRWIHYMNNTARAPKELSREPKPQWLKCEMIIGESQPNPLGTEVTIELITGRSHQIRAQLAFEGFPILGDIMYGGETDSNYHLKCCALEIPGMGLITLP